MTSKFQVDAWNNFCRVFELPESYPSGFCHGGGHSVNFQMVDWFYPCPDINQAGVSKEVWRKEVGEIEIHEVDADELAEMLLPWLRQKQYLKPGRDYLVMCDFGAVFRFSKDDF